MLFLDEIDALGQKRSQTRSSSMRGTVNQLLAELDGVQSDNEGVFVLAATNQPWDVDPALRRPGRLDRTLLVLPPDQEARESIVRHHLQGPTGRGHRRDAGSPRPPTGTPAPTWPTSASRRPSARCWPASAPATPG